MADTATEEKQEQGVDCPQCGKTMKNDHGLDIHVARAHKKSETKSSKKGNGHVADRVWLENDELHVQSGGNESVFKLGRPSIVVDLYEDTKNAAQDYVDSLSF